MNHIQIVVLSFASFLAVTASAPASDSPAAKQGAAAATNGPTKDGANDSASNLINLDSPDRVPGRFLVFLKKLGTETDIRNAADTLAAQFHGKVEQVYADPALPGFAVDMAETDVKALAKDPRVDRVYARLKSAYPKG
jgi:hypothetical protein